jgi:hypothetical protein
MTRAERTQRGLAVKASKYGNRKRQINGYTFDSLAEAARYEELLLLEAGGLIADLRVHPRYTLLPALRLSDGSLQQPITYIADFAYTENGRTVIEDVKGKETESWRIKAKLFRWAFPDHDLRVVRA